MRQEFDDESPCDGVDQDGVEPPGQLLSGMGPWGAGKTIFNTTLVKEVAGIGGPAEQLRTGSVAQNGRTCTSDQEEAPPEEAPPREEAPAHKERRGHRCTPL